MWEALKINRVRLLGLSVVASATLRAQPVRTKLFARVTRAIDHAFGWHRLPRPLGLLVLVGIRKQLRRHNLYDTSIAPSIPSPTPGATNTRHLVARTADGTLNDLQNPGMGRAESRFGRNVPVDRTYPDPISALLTPNPRTVSRELLTRDTFKPATTLNILAAAWLQFMIRDWISHGTSPKENPWQVPLDQDDSWPEHPMRIMRTLPDPTRTPEEDAAGLPPTYVNFETHWWDASQIYGSSLTYQSRIRTGMDGKLVDAETLLPADPLTEEHPANVPGFWLGLALFHDLFMREHNAICDRLRAEYPSWTDDELFDHARLINVGLLAKIHTVEWTTAILGHPTMQIGMRANWWGVAGERIHKLLGRIGDSEVLSGIPGSPTDHFGVPYAITEEFVAVYRMHPLIPDDFTFRSAADDALLQERQFPDIAGPRALQALSQMSMPDLLYSFGIAHPGAVVLHNFPRGLQSFQRPDGTLQDLAATDILRSRELGVPRYNDFRRLLDLKPIASFDELTPNPQWREELRRIYEDNVELLDLTIGMFAETPPKGFGFSDTAFRIFILMASRRLNSDRFFTTDYNATVYTQVGLDWIDDNTMSTVLLRHYPALAPALRGTRNTFAPWTRVSA